MYKYFISYQVAFGVNSFGFGHNETQINTKITGFEDIRNIAKSIEEHNNYPQGSVIILNFKPFEDANSD